MKLGFSEFSYGYAFTENLIRWSSSHPKAAPIFPNLVQEAQLGYDVKIDLPGVPLFFQFKLPELMVRHTAREISQFGLPGLSAPFFRMPLMRRNLSDQHIHMISLEGNFPASVFYASPRFQDTAAFNSAYCLARVHSCSALFSPAEIGPLPDDDSHSVSYGVASHIAWRCSEPKEVTAQDFESLAQRAASGIDERRGRTLEDTAREIRDGVWPLLPQDMRAAEAELRARIEDRRRASVPIDDRTRAVSTELLVLRELVRVGLGVDLLIAQPRQFKKVK